MTSASITDSERRKLLSVSPENNQSRMNRKHCSPIKNQDKTKLIISYKKKDFPYRSHIPRETLKAGERCISRNFYTLMKSGESHSDNFYCENKNPRELIAVIVLPFLVSFL